MSNRAVDSYLEPLQGRSRATLERILDAVTARLGTQRFAELSVETICADAGVSRSSFYARFPTRDALVLALADRYSQLIRDAAERAEADLLNLDGLSGGAVVAELVARFFEFIRATTPLRLTVEEHSSSHRRVGPAEDAVVHQLLQVADRFIGPLDDDDGQRIRFTSLVCAGALGHWVGGYWWRLSRDWWTDERFVTELTAMLCAYLASLGLIEPVEPPVPRSTVSAAPPSPGPVRPGLCDSERRGPTPSSYRLPKQRRSKETFSRILDTLEHLLQGRALDEVSIDLICAEAGVSQSSFFARFPTREALVEALADRYVERGESAVADAQTALAHLEDVSLEELIETVVQAYLDFERRFTPLRLVALEHPAARRRFGQVEDDAMDRLIELAANVLGPLGPEDRQRVRFLSVMCTGAVGQWVGGRVGPLARSWWSEQRFVTELARMMAAYIRVSGLGSIRPAP